MISSARLLCCLMVLLPACASRPPLPTTQPTAAVARPLYVDDLDAVVVPPVGWRIDREDRQAAYRQTVWISPTGDSAYGVVRFNLPFPASHDLVLWTFLRQMRASEGEARLLSKTWDGGGRFMRFATEGGRYRVSGNLIVRGLGGWVVYAGSSNLQPPNPREYKLAEHAREATAFGKPE